MENKKMSRVPAYIDVYNSLYSDITNGAYDSEEFLPGEVFLSEKYGVSRNTLRQALLILAEDGLIRRSQGKGTRIMPRVPSDYVQSSVCPLITQAKTKISQIDIKYNFGIPTDIAREKLDLDRSQIVLACDTVFRSGNGTEGYSFTQIPSHVIEEIGKDLSGANAVEELVSEDIFRYCDHWDATLKSITANTTEASFLEVSEGHVLLLVEAILKKDEKAIARVKMYFRPSHYQLRIRI